MSLRLRIFLFLVAVTLLPLGVVGIAVARVTRQQLEQQVSRDSLELVHSLAARLLEHVHSEVQQAHQWAQQLAVYESLPNRHFISEVLAPSGKALGGFGYLLLVGPAGEVVDATQPALVGKIVPEAVRGLAAKATAAAAVALGDPGPDPYGPSASLLIAVPVAASPTRSGVVLVASLRWQHLVQQIRKQTVGGVAQGKDFHIMLADRTGRVIACHVEEEMFNDNLVKVGMISAARAVRGEEGSTLEPVTEHGSAAFATYTNLDRYLELGSGLELVEDLPPLGWVLLLYQDPELVFAPVVTLQRIFLGGMAVLAGLLLVLASLVSSWVSRPVAALVDAARAAGEGTFRPVAESGNELGQLGAALNQAWRRIEAAQVERAQMSAHLVQASKLASLGTLAAGVAHEINNPLAIIRANHDLLVEELARVQTVDPDVKAALDDQRAATDRITGIVRRLLAYSRTDAPAPGQQADLHRVVEDTVSLTAATLRRGQVETEVRLRATSPWVVGNVGELQQIILNLVINARDAVEGVERARKIKIETAGLGDRVLLTVADNGTGIPPAVMPRIFDPFFTTKAPGKGTGLGLALVQSMLEKVGARVEVSSVPGAETRFTLSFVAAERAGPVEAPAQTAAQFPAKKYRGRILVVDDEPDVRRSLVRLLESMGLAVVEADDGDSGLERLERERFEFVLTDVRMPRLTGDLLLETARTRGYPGRFLVMTGGLDSEFAEDQFARLRQHSDGFLRKPFTREELGALLEAQSVEPQPAPGPASG